MKRVDDCSKHTICADCETAEVAWGWVSILAELATEGDEDAQRDLAAAITHALEISREVNR